MRLIFLTVFTLLLSACGSAPDKSISGPVSLRVHQVPEPQKGLSQEYAAQMTDMCYSKIQNAVGETRPHRGLIWMQCMQRYVMPVEQRLRPSKSAEIKRIYASLEADMRAVYEGRTTMRRLNRRWAHAQRQLGRDDVIQFREYGFYTSML